MAEAVRRTEERDARADRARVAAGAEILDRTDPGHDEDAPARGERRGGGDRSDGGRSPLDRWRGLTHCRSRGAVPGVPRPLDGPVTHDKSTLKGVTHD